MSTDPDQRLAAGFKAACLAELEAIKPGNVHVFADGHGMVVEDFVRSAEAAAGAIARPGISVGERIHCSVDASLRAVGCNTNLGIVLLCAPMIHAMLAGSAGDLRERLQRVLRNLSIADADLTFRAIVQAAPAGLGQSVRHDVHATPQVTLLEAMREAGQRDRIAFQFVNDYVDVFDFALPRYRELLARWDRPAWAVTGLYLGFLARWPDTHVTRKFGMAMAEAVRREAEMQERAFLGMDNPRQYQRPLLDFDASLKHRGINPGTSADLTVATLLAHALEKMVTEFAAS
ncbi:MAG: triphosphoribosyl-dephospho-CoA synthase [Methylobacterium sp.]|nr:triphosphoribosyl-dephospho-CoA synthase [Methylobacterium sp.]